MLSFFLNPYMSVVWYSVLDSLVFLLVTVTIALAISTYKTILNSLNEKGN